jgi:tetratricopeptide (TPR) repeat protein
MPLPKALSLPFQRKTCLCAGVSVIALIGSLALALQVLPTPPAPTMAAPAHSVGLESASAQVNSTQALNKNVFCQTSTVNAVAQNQPKTCKAALSVLAAGESCMSSNRPMQAIKDFDKAIALDPKLARAWQLRACVLQAQGQSAQALQATTRALAIEPNDAFSYQLKGHALFKLKKYAEATASFSRAIAIKPDVDSYTARAACQRMLKNYAGEIDDLSTAISQRPDNLLNHTDRALAYSNTKQYEKAIADYTCALRLPALLEKPDGAARAASKKAIKAHLTRQVGMCQFLQGHYDLALAQFKLVDNGDTSWPASQRAYYWRAIMFFDSGNPDRAIEDLKAALRFDPNNITVWRLLGGYCHGEGEDQEAENAITQVIKRSPLRDYYLERKLYRLSQNNLAGAISDLQTALKMKPEGYLFLELARLQQLAGQMPAARESFLRGVHSGAKLRDSHRDLQKLLNEDSVPQAKLKR